MRQLTLVIYICLDLSHITTVGSSVAWADDAFLVSYVLYIAKVLGRLYINGAAPVHADNTIVF